MMVRMMQVGRERGELTFSMKGRPQRWSCHGASAVLSRRIRNLRWKFRSLLRLGKRRWIVS